MDKNETDLNRGIPSEAHIPRPCDDIEKENIFDYVCNNEDVDTWKKEFNQSMGNVTIKSTDRQKFIESLQSAKMNIENILKYFEKNKTEEEEQVYFDIPYPVPDCINGKKDNPDQKVKLNSWSREKIELLEKIDQCYIESSCQMRTIQNLEQQIGETKLDNSILTERLEDCEEMLKYSNKAKYYLLEALKDILTKREEGINFDLGTYKGQIKNGKPEGNGHYEKNGMIYLGHFVDGLKEGYGVESTLNKKYEGMFKSGLYEGYGTLIENGNIYRGTFKDGMKNGYGKLYFSDGAKYVGEFTNDCQNGIGKSEDAEKNIYEGMWKKGFYCGEGKLLYNDGSVYEGSFVDSLPDGQGEFTAEDGVYYKGEWKDGKKEGVGTYVDTEGWRYEGQWENGKMHGHGKLTFQNASFEGSWKHGSRSGRGVYVFSNGDKYEGEWDCDMFEGDGHYRFNDGAVYEGKFARGWPNGEGVFVFPYGVEMKRDWKEHLPCGYRVEIPWQKTMFSVSASRRK